MDGSASSEGEQRDASYRAASEKLRALAEEAAPDEARRLRDMAAGIEWLGRQWEGFPSLSVGLAPQLPTDHSSEGEIYMRTMLANAAERSAAILAECAARLRAGKPFEPDKTD